jgi:hypothetical protein
MNPDRLIEALTSNTRIAVDEIIVRGGTTCIFARILKALKSRRRWKPSVGKKASILQKG